MRLCDNSGEKGQEIFRNGWAYKKFHNLSFFVLFTVTLNVRATRLLVVDLSY